MLRLTPCQGVGNVRGVYCSKETSLLLIWQRRGDMPPTINNCHTWIAQHSWLLGNIMETAVWLSMLFLFLHSGLFRHSIKIFSPDTHYSRVHLLQKVECLCQSYGEYFCQSHWLLQEKPSLVTSLVLFKKSPYNETIKHGVLPQSTPAILELPKIHNIWATWFWCLIVCLFSLLFTIWK